MDKNIIGKKITVVGIARSGIAVAKLLAQKGAKVFVTDNNKNQSTEKNLSELKKLNIQFEVGEHSSLAFDANLVVISPGVPPDSNFILEVITRNIPVVSEIEIASWFCDNQIIAVTGSSGKTTTVTLIERMLSDAKKKYITAGNIGKAFSSFVMDLVPKDIILLEVSSFQLDFCHTFHPSISVITNVTPNHLDRYKNSMELYANSKKRILKNQTLNDLLIYNYEDEWTKKIISNSTPKKIFFSTKSKKPLGTDGAFIDGEKLIVSMNGQLSEVINIHEISIKGEHNLKNAMASTLVAMSLGVNLASLRATLRNFKGVEHRQEFVAKINDVKFVNDSKATTVDSLRSALETINEPIILLLGGKDKGNDYSAINEIVKNKVRSIIAFGDSKEKIEKHFSKIVKTILIETIGNDKPNILSMHKVLDKAVEISEKGNTILLSPACASFDWFNDYEERGQVFKKLIYSMDKK
ncbi:MAG: UDP-N-acetylmuramoyl-L-alanine--D-glutamate ligase [Bacteroidetes bacterium]|nr:UDP-N-acetylmuramoyl-L-alanine--D-glutamate ligase [Bacteroidota bacterium]